MMKDLIKTPSPLYLLFQYIFRHAEASDTHLSSFPFLHNHGISALCDFSHTELLGEYLKIRFYTKNISFCMDLTFSKINLANIWIFVGDIMWRPETGVGGLGENLSWFIDCYPAIVICPVE